MNRLGKIIGNLKEILVDLDDLSRTIFYEEMNKSNNKSDFQAQNEEMIQCYSIQRSLFQGLRDSQ